MKLIGISNVRAAVRFKTRFAVDRSRGKICSSFQSEDLFFVLGQGKIKEVLVTA